MQPRQKIREYTLLTRLGGGGMGEVWEAYHERLHRTVAIKALPTGIAPTDDRLLRLRQEARNLARLSHPGIVAVYDCIEEESNLYLVMEFINGQSIQEVVAEKGGVSFLQCVLWFRQAAQALAYAHERHVFHRDIKPSNIMVDTAGNARLIDFGIALSDMESRITRTGGRVGTLPFMSPEQRRGDDVDGRSDIYSLALAMYCAVTAAVLSPDADGNHAYTTPLGTPACLDGILRRCLRRSASQRYASANDLVGDLDLALTRLQPSSSRPRGGRTRRLALPGFVAAVGLALAAAFFAAARLKHPEKRRPDAPPVPVAASPGAVAIPAGGFIAGMDLSDVPDGLRGRPGIEKLTQGGRRPVFVPAFRMDKHEVSNTDYGAFVRSTGRKPPAHWNGPSPPEEIARHPVVNVTFADAAAYAAWAGKRLPSADEWEKAARGEDGRVYPWGNAFEQGRCNSDEAGIAQTCPTDGFPRDRSPYGVLGMAGNAAEWTASTEEDVDGNAVRVICGGSWLESGVIVSIASFRRTASAEDVMREDIGFRCAESVRD